MLPLGAAGVLSLEFNLTKTRIRVLKPDIFTRMWGLAQHVAEQQQEQFGCIINSFSSGEQQVQLWILSELCVCVCIFVSVSVCVSVRMHNDSWWTSQFHCRIKVYAAYPSLWTWLMSSCPRSFLSASLRRRLPASHHIVLSQSHSVNY